MRRPVPVHCRSIPEVIPMRSDRTPGGGPQAADGGATRAARAFALLAALVACASAPVAGAQTPAAPARPALEAGVDARIPPGDDFFAFANGEWLQGTTIPAGRERWGARNEIDELTRRQIAALIDEAGAQPAGSLARKVADFRAAYLNEAAIEARGLASLRPQLERIDRVRNKATLTRLLGRGLAADVDPLNLGVYESAHLLGLAVEEGNHGEKTYVAYLLQGGLGLPDRDAYLAAAPAAQALRTRYQAYVGRLLALAGFDHAEQRAAAVLALETAIARTHATREASAEDSNADNLWTRADFARRAPGIDWSAFFAAAGLSQQQAFVVWQPGAVTGAAALVASQPLPAWKDYLRFRLLDRHADVLPRAYADQAFALHGTAVSGATQQVPREQRALGAIRQTLGEALGRMYVERYFPPAYKARVQAIAADVLAAFRQRVAAVAWLSPASRTQALAKVDAIYFGVGYPERWQDYADLTVDPRDAAGNLLRVAEHNYRHAVARLGRPVDRTEWWMSPQTVGAVLLFQQNAYNFPAALLQPPKFDPAASDAANYGAIGAIIGHEASHFVDTLGADYDAQGALRRWWTAADLAQFQAASAPLVEQFAGYRPLPDLALDGKLTLTENVADLGGLAAAFDAYRRTLGSRAADPEYVRQQDRQFFIGFARSWRSAIRDDALRAQVTGNDHAPERYRISTVRNLDAWYDAFDVRPGQRLYLAPEARVRIW
jgi:predicted metalloendopeptidase